MTSEGTVSPNVDPTKPEGSIVGTLIEGMKFALVHHAEGWVMFEDRCTHAGCSFVNDGGQVVDGTILMCACHGSEFDLRDGSVLEGPATQGLEVRALVVDGDRLRST
jgi:nitrite reductase/ring-hydroxylating ferredoxin subunit